MIFQNLRGSNKKMTQDMHNLYKLMNGEVFVNNDKLQKLDTWILLLYLPDNSFDTLTKSSEAVSTWKVAFIIYFKNVQNVFKIFYARV